MTKGYYVQRKAEDLRLGDFFVSWALGKGDDWVYGEPSRILNIRSLKNGKIQVNTADQQIAYLNPEHLVVVMEVA